MHTTRTSNYANVSNALRVPIPRTRLSLSETVDMCARRRTLRWCREPVDNSLLTVGTLCCKVVNDSWWHGWRFSSVKPSCRSRCAGSALFSLCTHFACLQSLHCSLCACLQSLHYSVCACLQGLHCSLCACLQGLRCSRCLFTQHCPGCVLPRDGSEVSLQPGDHLAVQFVDLSKSQMELAPRVVDHNSMDLLRPSQPLTLYDCFHAFTERFVSSLFYHVDECHVPVPRNVTWTGPMHYSSLF